MKRVGVIGHFGFGLDLANGQTIKTKIVTEAVSKAVDDSILTVDAHGGIKAVIPVAFGCLRCLRICENTILMLTENGLKVSVPVLSIGNKFFKRRLHYVVIGGWLPSFLEKQPFLKKCLKSFFCIYVETNTMKKTLEAMGLQNVVVMPNCKELRILKEDELVYSIAPPLKLCTFSRVMKEKGIEDAVNAVKKVNSKRGEKLFTLDIYGQIDSNQMEWFEGLKATFPEYINYCGVVPYDKSTEVLKNYFALLFPTCFYTEGIPGTIVDAYAAGVPVISSKWESFSDVIEEGTTGIGYEFNNYDNLVELLNIIAVNPSRLENLKKNCLTKAQDYTIEKAMEILGGGYDLSVRKLKSLFLLSSNSSTGLGNPAPLKLCTFSRVMKEKGIEEIVEAVKIVNSHFRKTLYTLDIYGQIEKQQEAWFEKLQSDFTDEICYRGVVAFRDSTQVLKNYFALVFPTYYEGEGFAGTIIDAEAAGVPVVASDWKYNTEIIEDGVNGKVFHTHDIAQLVGILEQIYADQSTWNSMKKVCLSHAMQFRPESVFKTILLNLK